MWYTRNMLNSCLQRCLVFLLLAPAVSAYADVQEGLWEITFSMRMDGTEQDLGPYTKQQCFTKADTQDPSKLFGDSDGSCEYVNKRYNGNQFYFSVRCNIGIPLSGTGQAEFSSDSLEGDMQLSAQTEGGPSVGTHSKVFGKRLGACPK